MDELPGVLEFPSRVIVPGEIDDSAGFTAFLHAAGIGTMSGYFPVIS